MSLIKFQESVVWGQTRTTTLYKSYLKKVRETCPAEQIPDYLGESLKAWATTTTAAEKVKGQGPIAVLGTVIKPDMVAKLAALIGIALARVIEQWIVNEPNPQNGDPKTDDSGSGSGSGSGAGDDTIGE